MAALLHRHFFGVKGHVREPFARHTLVHVLAKHGGGITRAARMWQGRFGGVAISYKIQINRLYLSRHGGGIEAGASRSL